MVAFNFMAQFANDVRCFDKRCTIRAAVKEAPGGMKTRSSRKWPSKGDRLQLYTGMRTSRCELLREVVCEGIKGIVINCKQRIVTFSDREEPLDNSQLERLAIDDGFCTADEFFAFFDKHHGGRLEGYLIWW